MNNHYSCKYRQNSTIFRDLKNKAIKKSALNLKGALVDHNS